MLPLWIIDLNGESERSRKLRSMVYDLCRQENPDDLTAARDESNRFSGESRWHYTWLSAAKVSDAAILLRGEHAVNGSQDEADDNAVDWNLLALRQLLVSEGSAFRERVKKSKAGTQGPLNVVVIADITDDYSRSLFPSFAFILYHEKERIIPFHVHLGLRVFGMLYIPTDINSRPYSERQKALRCIDEMELARKANTVGNYHRVIIHQELQHITQRYYPALDEAQIAELEFQYLLNLFYASDRSHSVIDYDGAPDNFYVSMGAASVFYDSKHRRQKELKELLAQLIDELKKPVDDAKKVDVEEVSGFRFPVDDDPVDIVDEDICVFSRHETYTKEEVDEAHSSDIHDVEGMLRKDCALTSTYEPMGSPSPDPILDFYKRSIKTEYYDNYLKYLPARIQRHVVDWIRPIVNHLTVKIMRNSELLFEDFEQQLHQGTADLLTQETSVGVKTGAFYRIDRHLRLLRKYLIRQRSIVQKWIQEPHRPLLEPAPNIKEYMEDMKGDGDPEEYKRQVMSSLKHKLQHEPTMWGLLVHTFFLSIVCVLAILPMLQWVSQSGIINLGDVEKHALLWSLLLFNIPLICQAIRLHLHFKSVRTDETRLQACYLREGQVNAERMFVRLATEYYDKAIRLVDRYLARLNAIRDKMSADFVKDKYPLEVPTTSFNQPVLGGKFNGHTFFDMGKEGSGSQMVINDIAVGQEVKRINSLSPVDFYLLIGECGAQHFPDIDQRGHKTLRTNLFACLFDGLETDDGGRKSIFKDENEPPADTQSHAFGDSADGDEQDNQRSEAPDDTAFMSVDNTDVNARQNVNALLNVCVNNLYTYLDSRIANRGDDSIGNLLIQLKYENEDKMDVKPFEKMCFTNGQVTSDDDEEYGNIKCDKDIASMLTLKPRNTEVQVVSNPAYKLYKKYLFITRWRTYNNICVNRLLPDEPLVLGTRITDDIAYSRSSLLLLALKKDEASFNSLNEGFCRLLDMNKIDNPETDANAQEAASEVDKFTKALERKI